MQKASATIGILGGGQLARMSAQAAQQMGFDVFILDPDPECPAAQVTPHSITGAIDDPSELKRLSERCEVITLENEWVLPESLRLLEDAGVAVHPGAETMALIGDKFAQREHFARSGLPVPEARVIAAQADARELAAAWGYPIVLKARLGGYDGYGVRLVRREADWESRFPEDTPGRWYAERFVPFDQELAVMVARSYEGETSVYPVVRSAQTADGHRCDWVIAPAPDIDPRIANRAEAIARDAVRAIDGIGIFGIELFLADNGEVIINEIAPRPHNSGHYTLDACATSQFTQHIRAVTGLALGPTRLLAPAAAMANLLGVGGGPYDTQAGLARAFSAVPSAHVHWYGKREGRPGRKMGHINVLADTADIAIVQAQAAREAFWGQDIVS